MCDVTLCRIKDLKKTRKISQAKSFSESLRVPYDVNSKVTCGTGYPSVVLSVLLSQRHVFSASTGSASLDDYSRFVSLKKKKKLKVFTVQLCSIARKSAH